MSLINNISILLLAFLLVACNNGGEKESLEEKKSINSSVISLVESNKDSYICIGNKNLGYINEGEIVEVSLQIRNDVGRDIAIKQMTTSCGCFDIQSNITSLAKDSFSTLIFMLDSRGKSGKEFFDILINTDSGNYTIEIEAFVK